MGYSKLMQKRKDHAERAVSIEPPRRDDLPKSDAPVFDAFYSAIVSAITGLVGSLYFAYKWFECLNYLIGRKLFKATALTVVWALWLAMAIIFIRKESPWLLFFAWVGRIALLAYMLLQLRKSQSHLPTVIKRLKVHTWVLYGLWFIGTMYIWWCGCGKGLHCPDRYYTWEDFSGWYYIFGDYAWHIIVFPILVLLEICLVQKMFNAAVCEASGGRGLLDAKFSADWCKFRIVSVWTVVGLSVLLFLWDIGVTAWILDGEIYHGFNSAGKFRFWTFCEGYSPHANWQLYLWCIAALAIFLHSDLAKKLVDIIAELFSMENLKRSCLAIRRFFTAMFPSVSNEKGTEA